MKSNASLPLSFGPKPTPPARWWLAWLQLLCAWLLCMLLCANVALVLTKGWPQDETRPQAKAQGDCAPTEVVAKPRRTPRCGGA